MIKRKHVFFVAGELSGDIHAAAVASLMKKKNPNLQITAIGGPHMEKAHIPLVAHINDLSVMGVVEVLFKYRKIKTILKKTADYIRKEMPDIVIFTDFPGFNLKLASMVKGLGIKLVYYVSPQIWAWHYSRIKTIKALFDEVIVLLPFEKDIYESEGVHSQYFGHPLAYKIKHYKIQKTFKNKKRYLVLFMPGSREHEIHSLFPVMNQIIDKWNLDNTDFYIACADTIDEKFLEEKTSSAKKVKIVKFHNYDLMAQADLIITASGTASLEASLFLKPVIVLYKVHFLSKLLFDWFVKVKYISLTNILLKKEVIPEFFKNYLDTNEILMRSYSLLKNSDKIMASLLKVRKKLYQGDSYKQIALHFLALLEDSTKKSERA